MTQAERDTSPPPAARQRLNLIEQVAADAVASDYGPAGEGGPAQGTRRQQVLVAAIALGIAGFVLAMGISARVLNAPVVDGQRAALIERIEAGEAVREQIVAEVAALRTQVEEERRAELALAAGGRQIAAQIADLELATGYVAVAGDGVVVTLTDAPPDPDSDNPELERVLDTDVQRAVNGLWASGAEAIAINGQRLTAVSAIRSAAGAILVNYRPLRPPYRIEALGPPEMLASFRDGADAAALRTVAADYGIGFDPQAAEGLQLPAAINALPELAEVVEAGAAQPTAGPQQAQQESQEQSPPAEAQSDEEEGSP